jgi:serine/threonine protein kinase
MAAVDVRETQGEAEARQSRKRKIKALSIKVPRSKKWQREILKGTIISSNNLTIVYKLTPKLGSLFTKAPLNEAGALSIEKERRVFARLNLPFSFKEGCLTTPSFGTDLFSVMCENFNKPRREAYSEFGGPLHLALLLTKALERLHAVGCCHGDVHNANLVVDEDVATLIDFASVGKLNERNKRTDLAALGWVLLETFTFNSRINKHACNVKLLAALELPRKGLHTLTTLITQLIASDQVGKA